MVSLTNNCLSANDVEMLKASSVGIGVAGREGSAASREADFAVDVSSALRRSSHTTALGQAWLTRTLQSTNVNVGSYDSYGWLCRVSHASMH